MILTKKILHNFWAERAIFNTPYPPPSLPLRKELFFAAFLTMLTSLQHSFNLHKRGCWKVYQTTMEEWG